MTLPVRALSLVVCVCVPLWLSAAIRQPIRKPTWDPAIPAVELFDALDRELVEVTVIAKSAHESNLFITNKSDSPVSVQVPDTVVAVHVLKQLQPPGAFQISGTGSSVNSGNSVSGQAQPVGGSVSSTNQSGQSPFSGVTGSQFFSIPPDKTILLQLKTVCLAHGQPDPLPKMSYKLMKVEDFTPNTRVRETLRRYAAGEISQSVAQAATWHLIDGLSWKTLAAERHGRIGGYPGKPQFTTRQLDEAQKLVEQLPQPEKTGRATARRTP